MTDAELCREVERLSTRSSRLESVFNVLLPAGVIAMGLGTVGTVISGVTALALPALSAATMSIAGLALAGVAIVWAAGSSQHMADSFQAKGRRRLDRLNSEQRKRAQRSPVLLARMKETHAAKRGWKSGILAAAAEKAFQIATDKAFTVHRPLKISPAHAAIS